MQWEAVGLLLSTMMMFMAVVVFLINILHLSTAGEEEDGLYFKDIQSNQEREEWAKLPLVSQTRTTSDWCEVTLDPTLLRSHWSKPS